MILMADLPLANADAIRRVIKTEKDMAIVPGRGGGTNVIFIKDPARFHVDYYGTEVSQAHEDYRGTGLSCEVIDSFRLHTDLARGKIPTR